MNRIILIGNGFDLAHKMKTSYNDFINHYWVNIVTQLQNAASHNITSKGIKFETEEIRVDEIHGPWGKETRIDATNFEALLTNLKSQNINLIFKNKFLEILTKKHTEQNWVDIENEYYNLLKESFKKENSTYKITELNKDFNQIQKLLEIYLNEVEEKFLTDFGNNIDDVRLKANIGYKIYSQFKLKDFTETSINKKAEIEFQKIQKDLKALKEDLITMPELSDYNQKIISRIGTNATIKETRELLISDSAINYFELMPEEILFLNFNYTFSEKIYVNHTEFESFDSNKNLKKHFIHIHGTTDKYDRNNVIFGFGDEIDEDYKSIENLNNNTYLENIKSIKYLETDNYKRLLEFVNSGDYQIFIFGHSCGISDRTLLNTLFEHKNCSSIKPFYHKKDSETDNYIDIVKNISRNFNSKINMRDKVVNKEYCESLS
ncbi:hypothetical protein DOS84_13450 [Flavobacterium aquariorum]|uniref:Bacteriophage abortive infection AbiH n=1 Tax=Flavobacterium aquariorum TaxID=2217670 RepID=A0A2W7TRL7_9FLAO|nr:AbiH family protein [Flavobacterium aquariorum]PZX92871.1 hypothetical protein DOS84_13450 [Flavobacterium aquariorum]